jgi:transposase
MKYTEENFKNAANPAQRRYAEKYNELGSHRKVAKFFGVNQSVVTRSLNSFDRRIENFVPAEMRLGKVTVQTDEKGEVVQRWVRQHPMAVTFESILEYAEGAAAGLRDKLKPLAKPKRNLTDSLSVYTAPDLHIGMCAWAEQSGHDFDLKIARRVYRGTFDALAARTQPTETALLLVPGDGTHANTQGGTTYAGTRVDIDTRFPRVAGETLGFYQYMVDALLRKHVRVIVKILAGNHDEDLAIMMAIALKALYSKEPRVEVSIDPSVFWRYRFGKCLIATTHGHTLKGQINKALAEIMAADWPKDWGETEHRHWYIGHVHHLTEDERRGCTVETLRTMAPKDAWHYNSGYRSGRELKCDLWHRDLGRLDTQRQPVADTEKK